MSDAWGNKFFEQLWFNMAEIGAKSTDENCNLVAFSCPSYSKAGLMCCFASMREVKTGLRYRSKACDIRLPLDDAITKEDVRQYDDNVKSYTDEIDSYVAKINDTNKSKFGVYRRLTNV